MQQILVIYLQEDIQYRVVLIQIVPYFQEVELQVHLWFITIQTTGNATDFGDLITAADNATAASNNTRGIIGGHYLSSSPHLSNIIESVTIQTTGNAVDYGDLFLARSQLGACSDSHGGLS